MTVSLSLFLSFVLGERCAKARVDDDDDDVHTRGGITRWPGRSTVGLMIDRLLSSLAGSTCSSSNGNKR